MYIPTIGDKIILTEDWKFDLWKEYRNRDLLDHFNLVKDPDGRLYFYRIADKDIPFRVTLPKNSKLTIDRIYVRKGAADFDSVTFRVFGLGKKSIRFWAKLKDVNEMEFESELRYT